MHFAIFGSPETGRVSAEPFDGESPRSSRSSATDGPAVWRWSAARITERPDDLVCRWVGAARPVGRGRRLPEETGYTGGASAQEAGARSGSPRRSARPTPPSPSSSPWVGHLFESPKPAGAGPPHPRDDARRRPRARSLRPCSGKSSPIPEEGGSGNRLSNAFWESSGHEMVWQTLEADKSQYSTVAATAPVLRSDARIKSGIRPRTFTNVCGENYSASAIFFFLAPL